MCSPSSGAGVTMVDSRLDGHHHSARDQILVAEDLAGVRHGAAGTPAPARISIASCFVCLSVHDSITASISSAH
jgi:hypothetical protein